LVSRRLASLTGSLWRPQLNAGTLGRRGMARWHLEVLRAALERRGWSCVELTSEVHGISAAWELRRSADSRVLHIDFEGIDDPRTLPVTESYGCHVREQRQLSLYFRRQRTLEIWNRELVAFVDGLEN
jgi:hypothetical protein